MARIADVQEVSLTSLVPYANNAKQHSAEQIEKIKDSIREFGFLTPCLIDENYNIIAGHGRVMAAKSLGMQTVPCVFIEGLTEAQRKAYILADNKLTELGEWNTDLVKDELEALNAEGFNTDITGFDIDAFNFTEEMGAEITPEELADIESKTPARVKRGEIWQLGEHRVMCGDSTDPADVEKLVGGGYSRPLIDRPAIRREL